MDYSAESMRKAFNFITQTESGKEMLLDNIYNFDISKYAVDYVDIFHPTIKKVIYNPPATIVFWTDNTKTVVVDTDGNWESVKKSNKSKREKKYKAWQEAGLLNAIAKKFYKNYQAEITKWIEEA